MMGMYSRIAARVRSRSVPVPVAEPWRQGQPYPKEDTSPDSYGDYLATSNDVYSCANLRAKALAKLPITVSDTAGKQQDPGKPLPQLLSRPNPHMTRRRVMMHTELCMAIWGEAVLLLERGETGLGLPREIWPVKPTLVKVVPHPEQFISGYVYTPPSGRPIPLQPSEVIHIQYPNPTDLYLPLPPMAAVRLAAEVASQSMKANWQLFKQGMMAGGFVSPEAGMSYAPEQAKELEELIAQRFTGQANAHRWQVLRYALNLKQMAVTPRDAEWIKGANLTFRQVCRGMGVPPPLVGDAEFATLANLTIYDRALWDHTMEFEAGYVADELTRQLAPAFGVGKVEFDLSNVVALQEDEKTKWDRQREQIRLGAITVNEWRADQGLKPVPWGDTWWAPTSMAPVDGAEPKKPAPRQVRSVPRRLPPLTEEEDGLRDDLERVLNRQRDAILQTLRQGEQIRTVAEAAEDPFDLPRWKERTRAACQARFVAATEKSMISEARLLRLTDEQLAALLEDRAVRAAIEANTQRFAHHVNTTTWEQVRGEISKGLRLRESLDQISSRVAHVMDVRVSEARTVAQSEITRSQTTGQLAAYQAAGVAYKRWMTMGDDVVRETHQRLHGDTRGLGEMFQVGGAMAHGPGQSGLPEEDCNCRCWLEPAAAKATLNGEVAGALAAVRQMLDEVPV